MANSKGVKLPKDLKDGPGSVWLTPNGYYRWKVMICGKTKASETKSLGKACTGLRKAIVELQGAKLHSENSERDRWRNTPLGPNRIDADKETWCEYVLSECKALEPTTIDLYLGTLRTHVADLLGWRKLGEIDSDDMRKLRKQLSDLLYADSIGLYAYNNVCSALSFCLRQAYDLEYIDENWATRLKLGRLEKKKLGEAKRGHRQKRRRYVTTDDKLRILKSLKGHWLYGPLLLGMLTGARPGEVAGLKWEHVHLDCEEPYFDVEWQVKRVKGQGLIEKRLKTENSYRQCALTKPLIAHLHPLERRSVYVFVNSNGGKLDTNTMCKVLRAKALELGVSCADGSPVVFTDFCRRAIATERQRAGVSVEKGAGILGHTAEVHRGVYTQEFREQLEVLRDNRRTLEAINAELLDGLAKAS